MNAILFDPADVLFFRDGRPMSGSLAGHGAAWPLPHVISAALHAALHRSGFAAHAHSHRTGSRGIYPDGTPRDQKFGSLKSAGPFPVSADGTWFFPRPLDLLSTSLGPALVPVLRPYGSSSLPSPLQAVVANTQPPSKELKNPSWYAQEAYQRYLTASAGSVTGQETVADADVFDPEQTIGIGIDANTGTTGAGSAEGQIYSAHYLRLRPGWRMGVCASACDKDLRDKDGNDDLISALLNGEGKKIVVGGQQRVCTATLFTPERLPLPQGMRNGFHEHRGKVLVKWVLLSPAVWPEIAADTLPGIKAHPGGWLPNWINPETGAVLLKGLGAPRADGESRAKWRARVQAGEAIEARLVAALVPKPIAVTGWALPNELTGEEGGAQSTHLGVAAGSIYYFEAGSIEAACKLAAVLNWHGESIGTTIMNRRSTLLGEKGFGLGVCGTWSYWQDVPGGPKAL